MGLFDSRKEQKSIKLVKKLQEQADSEWEKEVKRRREQELNDEAIAKELQAQLQDESTSTATPITETTNIPVSPVRTSSSSSSSPPPLPTKPRAYNSSISLVITPTTTSSVPTSQSFSSLLPKPLYGLSSSSSFSSSLQPSLPPRQQNMSPAPSFLTHKPVKSYLPSQTYKPELQFSLASPTPAPNSVFYQKTPALTAAAVTKPVVTVQPQNRTSDTITPAMRPTTSAPTHMAMPEPIDTISSNYTPVSTYHHTTTPTSSSDPILLQLQPRASTPNIPVVPAYTENNNNSSYPNYRRQNSTPISLPLGANDMVPSYTPPPVQQNYSGTTPPVQQSYNNTPPAQQSYNNTPPAQQNYNTTPPAQQSYNTTPPVQQSYNNVTPAQQNYNTPPAYIAQQSYNNTPASQPLKPKSYLHSPPAQYSSVPPQTIQQHSAPLIPTTVPLNNQTTTTVTPMPLNNQSTTNPYFKKQPSKLIFSNSVLSLKPDEEGEEEVDDEDDEWDNMIPVAKRAPTPPPPVVSDDESEYDYSDMIYDRRQEEENSLELESDPFADSFAVKAPKPVESSIRILDPTMLSRQLSTKIAVEDKKSDTIDEKQIDTRTSGVRTYEEKESEETVLERQDGVRTYEEKESEEIEPVFSTFQTPIQQARPVFTAENTLGPVYQQQQQSAFFNNTIIEEDVNNTVYPTNILRAGAPPKMSASNPYNKIQRAVPASDYGYYEEKKNSRGKTLPKLPESTTQEDRHITVASVNPEQRVWIRIHPTDTGKMLAERIHIVASYQTRRVTKITTKNGRNISLDNTPLFDDWDEIINFKEGEAWTVEWVPVESPYVDIITEGKEFMKLLKANFKSSSHKDT